MIEQQCTSQLHVASTADTIGYHYGCLEVANHPGLHRWHSQAGDEDRGRVWTDDGVDFLEGPYGPASDPDSLTCSDHFDDPDGTFIYCVRPKGHLGPHGNYHDEDSPTMWAGGSQCQAFDNGQCLGVAGHPGPHQYDVPSTYGTLSELAKTPEGAHIPARFEIVINGGKYAIAKKVRLNGLELPNIHDLSVEYGPSGARTVIIEILATDVIEVPS